MTGLPRDGSDAYSVTTLARVIVALVLTGMAIRYLVIPAVAWMLGA